MTTIDWLQAVREKKPVRRTIPAGLFSRSASEIAAGLKRAVLSDPRREGSGYALAMSILTFYINRAGRTLSLPRRRELARAKLALRKLFQEDHHA